MNIGELIKQERKRCGLSQEQLAQEAGITGRAVSNYENGKRDPQIVILGKILGAMGMQIQFVRMEEKE
jgi:transcriptional regulator with XRE-family HTH domain